MKRAWRNSDQVTVEKCLMVVTPRRAAHELYRIYVKVVFYSCLQFDRLAF